MTYAPTALIVDDDLDFRMSLEALVQREGFTTRAASSVAGARRQLAAGIPDVVLMDLKLPDGDGLEWVRSEEAAAGAEVIVITGVGSVDSAVTAMRGGALDYLTKPIDRARLSTALLNVARTRALKQEVGALRDELRDLGRFGSMVGRSAAMQEIYDLIVRVGPTDATVLISGESGTGKELVAGTIHRISPRRHRQFVVVNCGAIPAGLIESEFFGHERGSFTGADRQRIGFFERASGGTIFLDEVTEMPVDLQVKLLRVLESGTVVRVGGSELIRVDVRVVAATNRDPEEAVVSGHLRGDLYYRLNVFPIVMPALRSHPEDIPLLAEHFIAELNRTTDSKKQWTRAALDRLVRLPWTGNVRELKNVVQRAFILGGEKEIGAEDLPLAQALLMPTTSSSILELDLGVSIAVAEQRLILATLEMQHGDKRKTADILGISLKTLYNRLNVYAGGGGLRAITSAD